MTNGICQPTALTSAQYMTMTALVVHVFAGVLCGLVATGLYRLYSHIHEI
jgi:hypothetical protein